MSLNARAVALQGIGFAAALVAVQGFAPVLEQDGVGSDDVIFRRADSRIARQESQWDTFVPGDVLAQRRLAEDEILLTLIARAVTSGVLDQWH